MLRVRSLLLAALWLFRTTSADADDLLIPFLPEPDVPEADKDALTSALAVIGAITGYAFWRYFNNRGIDVTACVQRFCYSRRRRRRHSQADLDDETWEPCTAPPLFIPNLLVLHFSKKEARPDANRRALSALPELTDEGDEEEEEEEELHEQWVDVSVHSLTEPEGNTPPAEAEPSDDELSLVFSDEPQRPRPSSPITSPLPTKKSLAYNALKALIEKQAMRKVERRIVRRTMGDAEPWCPGLEVPLQSPLAVDRFAVPDSFVIQVDPFAAPPGACSNETN